MAARSNRSPSPLSSRPMNPNPRNSESNSTMRRSFSAHNPSAKPSLLTNPRRLDPTTPANSPSDFAARRRSVGREGIAPHLKDCEEKENDERENVLRASKLQSPAKGCKNFMAPTISAASKFTPSPRKKVLVERNDPVRTSVSFSDGKAIFFSDVPHDPELGSDSKIKKAAAETHPVSKPCKKVTFSEIPCSDSQHSDKSTVTDSDSLNLESEDLLTSSIAPLDADPSLPPYDPKTNYLSPRPQFIRYRPNPRVEMLKALDPYEFEEDGLMEEMISEGFMDSDEGSDESQTENPSKEEMEEVVAAASSADMVIGMDEEIVGVDTRATPEPCSEALPVSTTPVDEVSEEESVEKNEKKARGFLSRLMCFSMVLLLLVACASVSVRLVPPPSFVDQLPIRDLSFVELSKIYGQTRAAVASARLSLDCVARHVHQVSIKSFSLMLKLVNEIVEGEKKVPLKFMNLSDLQENSWREEGYFLKRVENLEEGGESDAEMDYGFEEDEYADEGEDVLDDAESEAFEEEEEEEEYAYAEDDEHDVVATEETVKLDDHSEPESAADSQNQETSQVEEAAAMEDEKSQALLINLGAADNAEATSIDRPMAEATPAQVRSLAVALPSLLAVVLGAAAFVYRYKRSPPSVEIEPMMRDNGVSSSFKAEPILHQEKEISERWETESEMSSSYQSRSHRNYANEVESSERKMRKCSQRESLASSSGFSGGSPSYGSFTTYERIPVKINGYGDDEIITPVRRSSRIRNQATSP